MQVATEENSLFKQSYKAYRLYKGKQTDFSDMLDLGALSAQEKNALTREGVEYRLVEGKDVLLFPDGSLIVKNFVPADQQLEVASRCINSYVFPPYRTNLFIYEKMHTGTQEVKSMYNVEKYQCNGKYSFDKKTRWSNVGWQYNWDCRCYFDTQTKIDSVLSSLHVDALAFLKREPLLASHVINHEDYLPQTAIINYYDPANHMGGHLDDGEPDQSHPIFSFNLGLSAVFLIGGRSKDTKPRAIRLDAGDLYIMSGESRLCYHGVPRVIAGSHQAQEGIQHEVDQGAPGQSTPNNSQQVLNYLSENRININFRQVFFDQVEKKQKKEEEQEEEEKD